MDVLYSSPLVWIAIILAGIAGCVATAAVANMRAGVPFNAVAGAWQKHVWSIIFFIPVPLLLTLPLGLIWAFLWLVLAPTVASKAYFGPKEPSFLTLATFHSGYAVVGLIVYYLVVAIA